MSFRAQEARTVLASVDDMKMTGKKKHIKTEGVAHHFLVRRWAHWSCVGHPQASPRFGGTGVLFVFDR